MKPRRLLWFLGGAAAAAFVVPTVWFRPFRVNHFYHRLFLRFILRRPMMLSQLRLLERFGIRAHARRLDDLSPDFQVREAGWLRRELAILQSYDRSRMSEDLALSAEILEWFMDDMVRGIDFMFHDYPVNQSMGIQTHLPDFMINVHQVNSAADADAYVDRIGRFDTAIDQVIEGLRLRQANGVVPPRFVIDRVIEQLDGFLSPTPSQHPLATTLEKHLLEKDLPREPYWTRVVVELVEVVYPAYRRLLEVLRDLREIAGEDDGVWRLPDGAAYYAHCLRHHTTTDLSAETIHEIGLSEVERIHSEMRTILKSLNLPADDVGAAMDRLNREERFLYPDTDEGRAAILTDYRRIIDEIDPHLDDLFDLRPSSGVAVEPVPAFMESTAPGAYYEAPPLDGSKPGVFHANLRSVEEVPKFGMRTLAYHEAIPGHHFQIGVAMELSHLPLFRRLIPFTAYQEGWALYAEHLAAEQGFQDDPHDRLGYLTAQLFRAVRLVVDTGIHHKRWTRQQAIDYMKAHSGIPETDLIAEVERYIVWPGQACAYMIGFLQILELRDRARQRLGEAFDLKSFHNQVLQEGGLPLPILEKRIEQWIEARLAS